ncbi:T9SS type A sorting domain-containing protein [Carboxylicivirga marina]|uniref:T9SS type A sorting domain-containing protein n=1 Tax=Carboxylicivirga marina TaxID=2800988 RepID=UPI002596B8FE|nr:T9SS type A sorting domain-containing protein [uncultured Carboxylicivirga sp.]
MKKRYFTPILIALVLSATVFYFVPNETKSPLKGQKTYTAQELRAQEIQKKLKRREAGYAKPDKPDEYLNYLYYLKTNNDPSKEYPHNHHLNELKSAKLKSAQLKSAKEDLNWIERGPGNVGGRTRGFIIDPTDNTGNTWFAGSVGGGIWKTTDAGQNWTTVSDNWPNLAVSSMAMAPSNSDVLYAGTGEGFWNLDAIMGNGIFKSTDHGATWSLLSSTESNGAFRFVNRLVVDPDDENIVYAATNWGIYKTADGGSSWNKVFQELYNNESSARRVQDLKMSPDNSSILIAGVNDYGVIQSFNKGKSWKLVNPKTQGRVEVGISEYNTDVMYALTSESNLSMSVDGGDNWVDVSFSGTEVKYLSGQGWYNNTLVAYPDDETKLFIGGVDLYRVTTEVGAANGVIGFDVNDNTTAYFEYTDVEGQYLGGGVKMTNGNVAGIGNVEMRFGGTNSQKAHRFTVSSSEAVVDESTFIYNDYVDVPFEVWDTENNQQLMVSFRDSDDNGAFNLTDTSIEQIIVHSSSYSSDNPSATIGVDGGVVTEQVAYVHPRMQESISWDPTGFVNVTLSLNKVEIKEQSMTYEKLSDWSANTSASNYVHADHHNLLVDDTQGAPFRVISCNDGGVAFSDNAGTSWSSPNNGYNTSQFYGVAKHPTLNQYAGGLQDNGTWMSIENPEKLTVWSEVAGGDGFSTIWNQSDADKIVGCYYYNTLFGSYDGGENWVSIQGVDGYNDDEISPFITRIENSKSNPDLLLVGNANGISKSEDFGLSWKLISVPASAWSDGGYNPHTAISPVNSKYIWAGTKVSANHPLALSKDGGETFGLVNTPFDTHSANISKIVAHPTDENSAYVLFSLYGAPKVFVTSDLGETWNELSGFGTAGSSSNGFPNVAVYSLIVMPHNTNVIWAGTEIGLFESIDGGANWLYADNGLPAVCIWDMKIVGQQVVVGTHGRGVWTVDMPELPTNIKQPFLSSGKSPTGKIAFKLELEQAFDKVDLYIDDEVVATYNNTTAGILSDEIETQITKSKLGVQAKASSDIVVVISNYVIMENYNLKEPIEKYMNPFTSERYDFIGSDFRISKELFDDWGIHIDRKENDDGDKVYEASVNPTYVLSYPITVLDNRDNAIMSYRDIALIESGEAGTSFGDDEYWDYVIVEGTKDGINWLPLADGYDVNYSDKWKDFADADNDYGNINKTPSSATIFEEHTINLHDTFEAGDVILIRFRLFSDANATGWGWVIDDIIIQETGTSVNVDETAGATFTVGPNPATNYIDVVIDSEERGDIALAVYDMSGRLVAVKDAYKDMDRWSDRISFNNQRKGALIVTLNINGKTYKKKIICR